MKYKFLLIYFFISFKIFSYDLASFSKKVKQNFDQMGLRSNFFNKSYNLIKKNTNNFTRSLTYLDLANYLDKSILDFLVFKLTEEDPSLIFLLVPSFFDQDLIDKFNIVYKKEIFLNQKGKNNFLFQVKSNINQFDQLSMFLNKIKNKFCIYILDTNKKSYNSLNLKNLEMFLQSLKNNLFYISSNYLDKNVLSKLLLNNNSIYFINNSYLDKAMSLKKFPSFLYYFDKAYKHIFDKLIIYNSAVLSAYGLTDCNDIDFFHDTRINMPHVKVPVPLSNQNVFFKRGYVMVEEKNGRVTIFEDYPARFKNINLNVTDIFKKKISIDELLYNPSYHFYFKDIKFATLNFMLYYKTNRNRPKDRPHISLMRSFLKKIK